MYGSVPIFRTTPRGIPLPSHHAVHLPIPVGKEHHHTRNAFHQLFVLAGQSHGCTPCIPFLSFSLTFLLFIYNLFHYFIRYLTTLAHLMVHPTYGQQVVIIQTPVIVRLNRYGMMDGQVLIVILPVCTVKVANTHLAEVLVSPAYLLPFLSPTPGAAEPVYVGYLLLGRRLPATVILAVMNATTIFT